VHDIARSTPTGGNDMKRNHKFQTILAIAILTSISIDAKALDCKDTLLPRSVGYVSSDITRLSLAYQLDDSAYYKARQDAQATGYIYGVPVSGSWQDYHEEAKRRAEALKVDRFEEYSVAYSTSGLTEDNLRILQACLAGENGWNLALERQGNGVYLVSIVNRRGPDAAPNLKGNVLNSSTNLAEADVNSLREDLGSRDFSRSHSIVAPIHPSDVKNVSVLAIRIGDDSKTLILPPLYIEPKPLPQINGYVGTYYLWGDARKPVGITKGGERLIFVDESGQPQTGVIGGNEIIIPGRPSGVLSPGYVKWTDLKLWSVKPFDPTDAMNAMIGDWTSNGQKASIALQNGKLIATNEGGQMADLVNLGSPLSWRAVQWDLSAVMSPDAKVIFWGKGIPWIR
jgi:hypothetical protein